MFLDPDAAKGTPSRDVVLVSVIITISLSVTIVLCGICQWCQRKLGKRYKNSLETVGTPDSSRCRSEKKAINDLDRDFWNNNDNTVQQKWSSYPPKEFILNISPYAPYGDPRLSLNGSLLSGAKLAASATAGLAGEREGCHGERQQLREDGMKSSVSAHSEPSIGKAGRGRWQMVQSQLAAGKLSLSKGLFTPLDGSPLDREGRMVVLSLVLGLSEQDDFANIPDLQTTGNQQNQNSQGDKRLPSGGKVVNTTPVPGQTQHEDTDHKTEPRSSVSDLVNSLTSEMLMLSPGSEDDEGHDSSSRENLGRIQFSVGYNFQESTLTVKILKAQELPAKDFSGTSDPFVKIYLLPDKKNKLETKVKRKNLNPHWNETFLFEGFPYEKVVQRVLYLQVLDYDRFSRNDPIGEVNIPLNKVDLTQMQTFWKDLKPCSDGSGSRGELLLSLCYNPSANSITVNIIKARNLKAMDIGGTSDPYVKVWLMYKDKRVEKKKTVVMKRCLNPVFNESFLFDIPTEKLRETTIIITVMDKDKLSRNDVIGKGGTLSKDLLTIFPNICKVVKKQWAWPSVFPNPWSNDHCFYNIDQAFAQALQVPIMDVPVASLATSSTIVSGDAVDKLKPKDRRAELTLCNNFQASTWAIKSAVAAHFDRATVLWLYQLQDHIPASDKCLLQDITKIMSPTQFSADTTFDSVKNASQALSTYVTSRHLLWLCNWQVDNKNKWNLAAVPYSGSSLLREALDLILIENKDKKVLASNSK
ncbi:PREDICTED: uncharacterized protein LOC106548477 [Thamnophis sirtalis]|uniref:Synaptotagmin-7 n=1 Tax=Thamnophis sirtalis TaxID=35019 RepID=A0A6I9YB38_9SAUR|nr:PREDICTED: uncharacterized protein LOC106548477 [Thamnophis sirtalis]